MGRRHNRIKAARKAAKEALDKETGSDLSDLYTHPTDLDGLAESSSEKPSIGAWMTPIQRAMVESDKTIPDYHLIDCHFSGCKDRIYHTLEHFTRCVISRGWDAAEAGRLWEERLGRDRRRISVAGPPPEPAVPIEPSATSPLDALLISERRRVAAAARHVVRPPEPQVSGSAGSFTRCDEEGYDDE